MASFIGPEGLGPVSRECRIADCNRRTSHYLLRETHQRMPALSTFGEERREVLASVLDSLATQTPDPDHTAACLHLLRHLIQTGPCGGAPPSRRAG
jgi:hypothetical protein